MKIGPVRLSAVSIAVLVIQLAIVCLIAAKYFYQRGTCPRVWTRAAVYDPDLFMRGRYLSMQLTVDGCQAAIRDEDRIASGRDGSISFPATLAVKNNTLVALRSTGWRYQSGTLDVIQRSGASCQAMMLQPPVDFYIAEHAQSPLPAKQGDELWIEVTVPPKGPPRPLQLAMKHPDGAWQPLTYR
jgi:hypothetical protein